MKPTSTLLLAAVLSGGRALAQAPCPTLPADHISRFTSVEPSTQPQDLRLPTTHAFQVLAQGGDAYTNATEGNMLESFDFTGYAPISGSSTNGYLSINHEGSGTTSGVSMLSLNFNAATKLWNTSAKHPVNFGPVVGTINNCSGTVTPWSTIVTCEENLGPTNPVDTNNDGYMDSGWNIEIDPATRAVKDQDGNGTPDKLWMMGRLKHENIVVAPDLRTVYEGADDGSANSFVYKYVTDTPGQLGKGKLYALQLSGAIGTATTGTWIQIPNATPTECNNTTVAARALGATSFNGVEDIEISPLTGQVYFTAKGPGTIYRFTDSGAAGTTVSNFEIFAGNSPTVTNQAYTINYGSGSISELWRTGNDNLTFDSQGNLYVLQDGGRNHIWLIKPCHTQAAPAVELFAVTPAGCEPTGMTFSPDERFIFVSMQSPDEKNTLATTDAAGQPVVFNKSTALVIGRKGTLGTATALATAKPELHKADVYPNPVSTEELTIRLSHRQREEATVTVYNALGARVLDQSATLNQGENTLKLPVSKLRNGYYNLVIKTATTTTTRPFIKQ
ncbi:alkaline phosphatase PhoX [Hymenobacter sp. AT01-02]|uniref:alkaline phosphatase PhoX n=1 Tax=Hymenobacter sp. AT01-02 TaxID=1571877 RepID=UPI0006960CD7|nr:alkaline phosphatase PhoX [Hymenobacter sp. AT01-02]